jgi:hypothetical protein
MQFISKYLGGVTDALGEPLPNRLPRKDLPA